MYALVGSSGLEPPTSRLSGARSNQLSYEPLLNGALRVRSCLLFGASPFLHHSGGDDGIRTHDPLLAGQVLSQLSYTPIFGFPPLFLFQLTSYPLLRDPSKLNNNDFDSSIKVCVPLSYSP